MITYISITYNYGLIFVTNNRQTNHLRIISLTNHITDKQITQRITSLANHINMFDLDEGSSQTVDIDGKVFDIKISSPDPGVEEAMQKAIQAAISSLRKELAKSS